MDTFVRVLSCEHTASPVRTLAAIVTFVELTFVQLVPFDEQYPVNVSFETVNCTQYGATAPATRAMSTALAPFTARHCISIPLLTVR